jgi:uncharacterized protein (TIGR02145 family)
MRNRLFVLVTLSTFFFLFSCAENSDFEAADLVACGVYNPSTHICDRRDGNLYRTVKMPGGRVWMAENLKYEIQGNKSKCYKDNLENCKIYGRLYSWENRNELCPEGWEMPDMKTDWEIMSEEVADDDLKAAIGWEAGINTDPYNFTALPGGAYIVKYMGEDIDIFGDASVCENVNGFENWGSDDRESLGKIAVFMGSSDQSKFIISNEQKLRFCLASNSYVSVRCVKKNF